MNHPETPYIVGRSSGVAAMRKLVPAVVLGLLALLPPSASAAQASGDLTSDAPAVLMGTGSAAGTRLFVYHYAFRDASLEGQVFTGVLTEHTVLESEFRDETPIDAECRKAFDRTEESKPVAYANATAPDEIMTVRLKSGAITRLDIGEQARLGTTAFGQTPDADTEFAVLGPSPYWYEPRQQFFSGQIPAQLAPALPATQFVVAPTRAFNTLDAFTLEVFAGTLEVVQRGATVAFAAGVSHEERRLENEDDLLPSHKDCPVRVIRTLALDADVSFIGIDQTGLDRAQSFWDGADPGDAFGVGQSAPAKGYWDRERADDFGAALETFLMPATTVSAEELVVAVDGAARFERALGALHIGGKLREANNVTLTLGGSLNVQPTATDDGRRMTVRIGNDVSSFVIEGEDDSGFLAKYGVFAFGALGGAAALGAAYYAWPTAKLGATKWALFPLYARLKREDILENPLRDDILQVVEQAPGISASDLSRRLACGWGTLVYHLTVLERMQLLSSTREGRHRRFFVQGRINYSDKGAVALLANPASRAILDAVRAHPGLIQRDLGRNLGLSAGTVAWHVERLAHAGLVLKEEEGRVVRYYPSQKLLELTQQLAA